REQQPYSERCSYPTAQERHHHEFPPTVNGYANHLAAPTLSPPGPGIPLMINPEPADGEPAHGLSSAGSPGVGRATVGPPLPGFRVYWQARRGRAGREVGAFCVRVELLSWQEPGDRDSGVARGAPCGGGMRLSLSRWNRRVPARHDAVLLGDLVLDLDVQAGVGVAVTRHELAHACWAGHFRLGAGDVANVVGGYQLV